MECAVRFVVQDGVLDFQSRVEDVVLNDPALIYLRYPDGIRRQRFRGELRVDTRFDVQIWYSEGRNGRATVLNLSRGGCLLGTHGLILSAGSRLTLGCVLPNHQILMNVSCLACRIQGPELAGVEFEDLSEAQIRDLDHYMRAVRHPHEHEEITLGRGFVGDLERMPLTVLAPSVAASGRPYVIHLWDEPRTGRLYFDRGELIHASVGAMKGGMALQEMARWVRGQFCLSVAEEIPHRNVSGPVGELVEQPPRAGGAKD
jgi:hypothetical protein